LPFQVIFPKQVSAHLENISVFKDANNIAAIVYQGLLLCGGRSAGDMIYFVGRG
jgi:hypothetical protein